MTEQATDYQAARRRVMRRIRRRALFAVDLLLYVLLLFSRDPNAAITAAIWPVLLLAHFIYAFDIWGNWVERATRREMARMQDKGDTVPGAAEKRKRTKAKRLALSDDGELIGDDEDEEVYDAQERRQ